ncbi:MAG TPA: hypothetical protein VFF13_00205 [archaeon]|nr:hypothetical protein [archaeon]
MQSKYLLFLTVLFAVVVFSSVAFAASVGSTQNESCSYGPFASRCVAECRSENSPYFIFDLDASPICQCVNSIPASYSQDYAETERTYCGSASDTDRIVSDSNSVTEDTISDLNATPETTISDSNSINELNLNNCFEELLKGEKGKAVHVNNANGDVRYTLSEIYGAAGSESQHREDGKFDYVGASSLNRVANALVADSFGGRTLRRVFNWTVGWGKIPETYTYDQPNTSAFFQSVDSIQGTETERIRRTYNLVNESIPNYRYEEEGEPMRTLPFEEILAGKTALCREQAMLLNSALTKQGIQSKIILTGKHAWVRVTVSQPDSACDGQTFDLDPTWYKSFVPLEVRN